MIASNVRKWRKWLGAGAIAGVLAIAASGVVLAQSEPGSDPAGPTDEELKACTAQGGGWSQSQHKCVVEDTTTVKKRCTDQGGTFDEAKGLCNLPGGGAAGTGGGDNDEDGRPPSVVYANMSGQTMQSEASNMIHKMLDSLAKMVELQQVARKQKDIIKLNCVNEKLLASKQLVNIAEDNRAELAQAIARHDEEGRYDYYSSIVIAFEKQQALASEAENCIGEDLSFLGEAETTTEGGNEDDDPTTTTEPGLPDVEVPPIATPFI